MRSKLKRKKCCKHAARPEKAQDQTHQVIEITSESDGSEVGTAFNNTNLTSREDYKRLAPIFTSAKSKHVNSSISHRESEEFPISDLDVCLRDVHVSNPTFPVNVFINILRNKGGLTCNDNIHERTSVAEADNTSHVEDSAKSTPVKLHRLSRTRKLKYGSVKAEDSTEQHNNIIQEAKSHHQPVQASDVHQREPFSEDALWTDTYCPRHSSEVIGNTAAIEELHRWLNKWKKKADVEDKKISTEKQNKTHSNDVWDCGDFEGEAGSDSEAEEQLHNTVLISGPPGVGKTAAVYACALELGFKVFEVNCSSQRRGRDVLTQLKEATQSHQLETSAKDSLKPAFYNSYGKSEKLPARSQKKASVSICKKKPVQIRSSCRNSVKRITLTNYFKTKAKADYLYSSGASPSKKLQKSADPETHDSPNGKTKQDILMSLILFEEVDVIFEEDVGFLTAVKTFMTTTKRPVVLMTSDPLFRDKFHSDLVEIIFETPSRADVCSYLQLVCLAQKVRLDSEDANTLSSATRGDVRRALLQLQFWANSGAGRGGLKIDDGESTYKGCSADMLGLQSITKNNLFQFLQLTLWTQQQMAELHQAVVESWRNGFPILYSNLEFLLHVNSNKLENACSGSKMLSCYAPQLGTTCGGYSTTSSATRTKSRLGRKKNDPSTLAQRSSDKPVDGLTALSDLLDAMSFIDSTFPAAHYPRNLEDFVWTGAKIQDGLLDKPREEEDEDQEMKLDMRATLEALGVHRCWRNAASEVQKSRQGNAENLCYISPNRHMFDLNKKVLSSQYFSLLHNTRAACQDYLPVIRYVCRIHRKQRTLRCINTFRTPLGLTKETVRLLAGEFS